MRWQKWRLRVGFNAREGLVLHAIGYEDGGRLRPVLHRAALSEMVVPYGHPGGGHFRKNAFDVGEYGIGVLANSLTLGCDCLGAIRYFDAWLADSKGEPYCIPSAVCLHEEDFGILWKHTDLFTGEVDVRRARRLVVSSISTVGNYEYGSFWYFHQDGSIHFEIKATGIVNTAGLEPGEQPLYGTIVSPGVYAHYHQHIFNMRLDVAVDGERNRVVEVDTVALPVGPDNPHGNAFTIRENVLANELAAQRTVDFNAARFWKIESADARNKLGQPTAYKLLPLSPVPAFASPQSSVARRAAFMTRQLWVTAYHPDEIHAAGRYPNQSSGGDGLPAWTAADRPLVDTDIVVWHSFGLHHIPRPEDFPVQPVITAGFALHPVGVLHREPGARRPAGQEQHELLRRLIGRNAGAGRRRSRSARCRGPIHNPEELTMSSILNRRHALQLVLGAGASAMSLPAAAHHGWSWAEDDQSTLTGTDPDDLDGAAASLAAGKGGRRRRLAGRSGQSQPDRAVGIHGDLRPRRAMPSSCWATATRTRRKMHMKAVRITIAGKNYDMYPERIRTN